MRRRAIAVLAAVLTAAMIQPARAEMPDGIYVRIVPLDSPLKGPDRCAIWARQGYTAQDILKMIEDLRPSVLDRFMTGKQNPDAKVPVAAGAADMTVLQFLNAAMKAGAPGCLLAPKVHLNDTWPEDYRWQAAKALLDLPLATPLRAISLDCWFSDGDAATQKQRLQRFKDMGWPDLGFNCATHMPIAGYASFGMVLINPRGWKVEPERVAWLKRNGIKTRLLHIDYPNQITEFGQLPPDQQADIITKTICPAQKKLGFRFIYPILHSQYDATKMVTSKDGPYKGATLYEVMKQQIERDRKELAPQ